MANKGLGELNLSNEILEKASKKARLDITKICRRHKITDKAIRMSLLNQFRNFYIDKHLIKDGSSNDFADGLYDLEEEVIPALQKLSKQYEDIEILRKLSASYSPFLAFKDVLLEHNVLNFSKIDNYFHGFHEIEEKIKKLEKVELKS